MCSTVDPSNNVTNHALILAHPHAFDLELPLLSCLDLHCSEAELEALCETLYNDSLALIRQAALYVIDEEGEERDEPPGARAATASAGLTSPACLPPARPLPPAAWHF